jgi:glycerol-3-phosphate cytidylyltransferase
MRVGIVVGAFDLLHAGHIHLLKQCRKKCDKLIVAIHADPSVERDSKNKPIESVFEREVKLNACKYVDFTVVYEKEDDLPLIFQYFKINVRFLGSDYITGTKSITAESMIPIEYIESLPIHSSSIRERVKNS